MQNIKKKTKAAFEKTTIVSGAITTFIREEPFRSEKRSISQSTCICGLKKKNFKKSLRTLKKTYFYQHHKLAHFPPSLKKKNTQYLYCGSVVRVKFSGQESKADSSLMCNSAWLEQELCYIVQQRLPRVEQSRNSIFTAP